MAKAKPRTERAPAPPRKCKTCTATIARSAKHGQCRRCYDLDRADGASAREIERRQARDWKRFLGNWARLAKAIDEVADAEKLLLKYGRLAREGGGGGKWRLTDLDLQTSRAHGRRFRRGAVLFLAKVRGIAIVRSRGVCELLDPNQVKVTAA